MTQWLLVKALTPPYVLDVLVVRTDIKRSRGLFTARGIFLAGSESSWGTNRRSPYNETSWKMQSSDVFNGQIAIAHGKPGRATGSNGKQTHRLPKLPGAGLDWTGGWKLLETEGRYDVLIIRLGTRSYTRHEANRKEGAVWYLAKCSTVFLL